MAAKGKFEDSGIGSKGSIDDGDFSMRGSGSEGGSASRGRVRGSDTSDSNHLGDTQNSITSRSSSIDSCSVSMSIELSKVNTISCLSGSSGRTLGETPAWVAVADPTLDGLCDPEALVALADPEAWMASVDPEFPVDLADMGHG